MVTMGNPAEQVPEPGQDPWAGQGLVHKQEWLRCFLTVSEGFCPFHGALRPVPHDGTVSSGGHCRECRAYWSTAGDKVTWTRDYFGPDDSLTPVTPDWVVLNPDWGING